MQPLSHSLDEVVLIIRLPPRLCTLMQTLRLIISPESFYELVYRELSLAVNEHCLELLGPRELFLFLRDGTPLLGEEGAEQEFGEELSLPNRVVVLEVEHVLFL